MKQSAEILNHDFPLLLDERYQEVLKDFGNVILFPDEENELVHLRGALNGSFDRFGSCKTFSVTKSGILEMDATFDSDEQHQEWYEKYKVARQIRVVLESINKPYITFSTDIEHTVFNLMKGGKLFSKGIMFSLDNLA